MDRVSMRIEDLGDGAVRLVAHGAITQETCRELKVVFERVLAGKPCRVDFDCAGVDYIASVGVGALVSFLRKLRELNAALRILNLQPDIAQLFTVTHLDKIFTVERETAAETAG